MRSWDRERSKAGAQEPEVGCDTMRAPQHPGTALQSRSLLLTVEPVDSPHLILGDALFTSQGGVDVHEGVGVQ